MIENLLDKNLKNIQTETDLFGTEIKKLSMKERIGFIPISVWRPDWNVVNELKGIIGDDGSTRELVGDKMSLMGSKYEVSIFNPHLAQMILSAYAPAHAKIFDPFAGGGTRGFVASAMGHTYYGIEVRPEEVERIKKQQQNLQNEFKIVVGDSCDPDLANHIDQDFTFCYTCPPYWNLEVYSNDPKDISTYPCYSDFLEQGIKVALQNCYAALLPGSFCIWVVGNFRDDKGRLIHFNGDVIRIAKEVGFVLHDELVFQGAAGVAASRAGQFLADRKSVRVHEYIIILKTQ
jgi:DNA modification methylase